MSRYSIKEDLRAKKSNEHTALRQEIHTASPNIFHHGSPISMSCTMSFVYHLPPGHNQSNCSHPGSLSISKIASCLSVGHEGKDVVAMRIRNASFLLTDVLCSVADRAMNSEFVHSFRHRLHTSLRMLLQFDKPTATTTQS